MGDGRFLFGSKHVCVHEGGGSGWGKGDGCRIPKPHTDARVPPPPLRVHVFVLRGASGRPRGKRRSSPIGRWWCGTQSVRGLGRNGAREGRGDAPSANQRPRRPLFTIHLRWRGSAARRRRRATTPHPVPHECGATPATELADCVGRGGPRLTLGGVAAPRRPGGVETGRSRGSAGAGRAVYTVSRHPASITRSPPFQEPFARLFSRGASAPLSTHGAQPARILYPVARRGTPPIGRSGYARCPLN